MHHDSSQLTGKKLEYGLSAEQQEMFRKTEEFASHEISPHLHQLEEDQSFRKELYGKMAKKGFFLLSVPKEEGGHFTDTLSYLLHLKAISKADAGVTVALAVTNMVAETIVKYGTEEQKRKYISLLASEDGVPASFALTEREAGSDAKQLSLQALPDPGNPDFYILNGEKHFISNADTAGCIILCARTDNTKESKGITAFLVDRGTPGLHVVKKERKLGLLTANLVNLELRDCRLHKDQILGGEGQGFRIALSSLDNGRLGIAAQSLGIAEAAYEKALQHAKQRVQFGHALAENQAIAFKLADMHMKISAGNLLMQKAAWKKDTLQNYTLDASEAKLYCSEAAIEIVNDALQVFGGYGYVKDYLIEKYYRDVRVTTLYEGTSEIQRIVIARNILQTSHF